VIAVTRLNGRHLVINAEQIRYIESTPDTLITLMSGDKIMVREKMEEVVKLAIEYGRQVRAGWT